MQLVVTPKQQIFGGSGRVVFTAAQWTHTTPLSGTTQVSRYQNGKTNLDFTGARDSEWQWHQLGHMQVWNSLQTDNHASTSLLNFFQAGCPLPFLSPNQQRQSTEVREIFAFNSKI